MANVKKVQKDISLTEFKAWLEGVEELQARTWFPDDKQWKLIRKKINCIVETSRHLVQPASHPGVPQMPIYEAPQAPTSFETAEIGEPSPAAQELLKAGDASKKTPDIDTADGNYQSDFG